MVFGFFDEDIEEELGGAVHLRVVVAEKFFVAGECEMFPDMLTDPCAADGPHAIAG